MALCPIQRKEHRGQVSCLRTQVSRLGLESTLCWLIRNTRVWNIALWSQTIFFSVDNTNTWCMECNWQFMIWFQIIVMKDGKISRQGTRQEIARLDPALYCRWKRAVHLVSESETESEVESETTTVIDCLLVVVVSGSLVYFSHSLV